MSKRGGGTQVNVPVIKDVFNLRNFIFFPFIASHFTS